MGWCPGSGVGVPLRLAVLRRTDVGLGVLISLLHCAVGRSTRSCCQLGFRMQPNNVWSGFLAVVLLQAVALGALFVLAVGTVEARDVGQVGVLGPHSRRKRLEVELGLAALAAFLQELVDGQVGLFNQQSALIVQSWICKAALTLLYQCVQPYS